MTPSVSKRPPKDAPRNPTFDWASAILLDSLIAEVAYELEMEEREMIIRHANIQ